MPPPRRIEKLFHRLLPPACREYVLGDLHERFTSRRQYLIEGIAVLGPVVVSRMRRTTDIQVFVMEAFALYLSFSTVAWYLGQRTFLYDHAGFARVAVPTVITVIGLLLCNAYSDPSRVSFVKAMLHSAGSISFGFLGQSLLFDTWPSLAVPFPIMLYGSIIGFALVCPLRVLFPGNRAIP